MDEHERGSFDDDDDDNDNDEDDDNLFSTLVVSPLATDAYTPFPPITNNTLSREGDMHKVG